MPKEIRKIKAWAIKCLYCKPFCHHEAENFDIYPTLKQAQKNMVHTDGLKKCTDDEIIPVLITPINPKRKKNK